MSLAGGKLKISGETIVTIVVCIIIMILLMLFVQRDQSRVRPCVRYLKTVEPPSLWESMSTATISLTFAIGSGLAAIAGVLLCSAYPSVTPYTGAMPGIKAFVAAVFGGIGSIPGAFIGGLLLGVIEILGKGIYFVPDGRCHCICGFDHCIAGKTDRIVRQENSGESVGESG